MDTKNLLRLTDEIEDPLMELRLALSDVVRAAQRTVGRALEISPIRGVTRSLLRPRVKVVDKESETIVIAELPGIPPESLAVTLHAGGVLCIEVGEDRHSKQSTRKHAGPHLGVRPLTRSITLPRNLDQAKATAVFENGKLTVRAPKLKDEAAVSSIGTRAA
jgi:HSP20 family molecular chaperone IbpA